MPPSLRTFERAVLLKNRYLNLRIITHKTYLANKEGKKTSPGREFYFTDSLHMIHTAS